MFDSIVSIFCSISMLFSTGAATAQNQPKATDYQPTEIIQEYEQVSETQELSSENSDFNTSGHIFWRYDNETTTHPLRGVRVDIFSGTSKINDTNIVTKTDGSFSLTKHSACDPSGRYIRIFPEGSYATVLSLKTSTPAQHYIESDPASNIVVNNTAQINITIVIRTTDDSIPGIDDVDYTKQAFLVHQACHMSALYIKSITYDGQSGLNMSPITVYYPNLVEDSSSGADNYCYFDGQSIYLKFPSHAIDPNNTDDLYPIVKEKLWDITMHEYGHYINSQFNLATSVGGTHYGGESIYSYLMTLEHDQSTNYSQLKEYAAKLAWSEGLASYFAQAAQVYNGVRHNNSEYFEGIAYTCDFLNGDSYHSVGKGELCENTTTVFLYYLMDEEKRFDGFNLGHENVWQFLNDKPETADTFYEFFLHCQTKGLDDVRLGELFTYLGVAPAITEVSPDSDGDLMVKWRPGGGEDYLFNNEFYIALYDGNGVLLENASYSLSPTQIKEMINTYGYIEFSTTFPNLELLMFDSESNSYSVSITGKQDYVVKETESQNINDKYVLYDGFSTGPYPSRTIFSSKDEPLYLYCTEEENMYFERVCALNDGDSIEYNIVFLTPGTRIIQTLGFYHTKIEVYCNDLYLCEDSESHGMVDNGLICLTNVTAGANYTIRIFKNDVEETYEMKYGSVKLMITPASGEWMYYMPDGHEYEYISQYVLPENNSAWSSPEYQSTIMHRFSSNISAEYIFETDGEYATCLYFIDPYKHIDAIYGCSTDASSEVRVNMQINADYLVVSSFCDFNYVNMPHVVNVTQCEPEE